MKLNQLVITLALSLGVAGAVTATTQPASAATDNSQYYKTYRAIPKVLRGTWRTKGYTEYSGESKKKVRWTYTFKKHSYTMKVDFQGKKKSKTIHFLKKEIRDIDYRYKTKQYEIYPTAATDSKRAYASILYLKPAKKHGKKVIKSYPIVGKHITYLYRR
ncbi:hypothetical protein [Levilactobacillus suantsaiihabitans]|uniref:DUF4767 domain-containing protein n=1 Tax=Levilactobacillus suantsaiihabitans TaxID=2487722 RepID=A0A4Z0J9F2_9LACO|nr:hypothetical protein [Levilactobacillus suantsaiihabitans]TGD17626.1 hypothetical protein EGT51_11675 [Levilactobacillus suantsaiihabitans]